MHRLRSRSTFNNRTYSGQKRGASIDAFARGNGCYETRKSRARPFDGDQPPAFVTSQSITSNSVAVLARIPLTKNVGVPDTLRAFPELTS